MRLITYFMSGPKGFTFVSKYLLVTVKAAKKIFFLLIMLNIFFHGKH